MIHIFKLSHLVLLWLFVTHTALSDNLTESTNSTYKFYLGGWTPLIKEYQKELLDAIFSKTEREFGAYELRYVSEVMTDKRIVEELGRGHHIQLGFYTIFNGRQNKEDNYVSIPFPIMQGLLGLRKVVIRKADDKKFSQINSISDFRAVNFGQVSRWPDTKLYHHAQLRVAGGQSFSNLFPMLVAKRFDAIPLSVVEIDATLEQQDSTLNELVVNNDIYIYYPIPVHLSVTKNHPNLLPRMIKGIADIERSGEFNKIFTKYFDEYIQRIHAENANVFVLENSTLTKDENVAFTNAIMNSYFKSNGQLFYLYEVL